MIQFGFIQNSMTRMPYEKSLENQYNNIFNKLFELLLLKQQDERIK